jgi:hypothetical protein
MKPFLAVISPMAAPGKPGGPVDPGYGVDEGTGWLRPSHPIFYPLPPGAPVDPSYGIPIDGPHPDQGLPGDQPKPDQGLPGSQPKPDQGLPGSQPKPSHPIVLPPNSGGWGPVYIWGPTDPRPTPPIVLPPIDSTPPSGVPKIEWKAMWTPTTGWVVVGVPTGPHPTPSKK